MPEIRREKMSPVSKNETSRINIKNPMMRI
jgi:hypothetical protein